VLDQALRTAGIVREDVYVTNAVKAVVHTPPAQETGHARDLGLPALARS